MTQEFRFCLKLTENEHYIVEDMIQAECDRLGLKLEFYRELEDGHVPMYREVKITGKTELLNDFFDKEHLADFVEPHPHGDQNVLFFFKSEEGTAVYGIKKSMDKIGI